MMINQDFTNKLSQTSSSRRSNKNLLFFGASLSIILGCTNGVILPPVQANPTLPTVKIAQTGTIIYVNSSNGSDSSGNGSQTSPYQTITNALSQAQPGAVVQVAPGQYTQETFPLTVPSGVILKGDESTKGQTTIVTGGGTYISPSFASQSVTIVANSSSEVRGLTISNPNTRGTGLWVESTTPTIANNTFSNSAREGIFVTGTGAPLITNNIFTKNSGNGISLTRSSAGTIQNNVFQNTGYGIAVGDNSSTLISNNQITQNVDGIVVSNSAQPVLRNNVIQGNTQYGVIAISNAQPDLGNGTSPGQNLIRNNGNYDVYNATSNITISAVGNDINQSRISGRVNFVAAQVPSGSLTDITGNWAEAYIRALSGKGIIAGFPDGTYRPNDPVTRAQIAAIIDKAFVPTSQKSCSDFPDVSSSFWGYQAIKDTCQGGFLSGYTDGTFLPNQAIPRVQVLVALVSGLNLRSNNTGVLSVFTDANQIPSWATTAIAGAVTSQLVINYPQVNQLNPSQQATRADVAAFVYQALVNAGKASAISSPYLVTSP